MRLFPFVTAAFPTNSDCPQPLFVEEITTTDLVSTSTIDHYFATSGFLDPDLPHPILDTDVATYVVDPNLDSFDSTSSLLPPLAPDYDHPLSAVHSLLSLPLSLPDDDALTICQTALDPGTRGLYALDPKIRALGITRSEFYDILRADETLLRPTAPLCAHVDGGSRTKFSTC